MDGTEAHLKGIAGVIAIVAVTIAALSAFQGTVPDAYAANTGGNVVASVNVPSVCEISLSPNAISFGTLNPGTSVPTNAEVIDTNHGNLQALIYVYGGNWMNGGSFGFGVSNTVWANLPNTPYGSATPLTLAASSTVNYVGSVPAAEYFGLAVPNGQAAATYNQLITLENVC